MVGGKHLQECTACGERGERFRGGCYPWNNREAQRVCGLDHSLVAVRHNDQVTSRAQHLFNLSRQVKQCPRQRCNPLEATRAAL